MQHSDAPAINRLGNDRITEHFQITRQAVDYWRREGIPRQHRKSFVMLATFHGVLVPEVTL